MTKLIIYLSIAFGFSVFNGEEVKSAEKHVENETIAVLAIEDSAKEVSIEKEKAYEAYLEVLGQVGPKEGEIAEVNTNSKSISTEAVKTSYAATKNKTEVPTKVDKDEVKTKNEINPEAVAVDHKAFGALLQKHVDAKGNVDYAGFKTDKVKLEAYINTLASNPTDQNMGKNERLSYWINLYNAVTIKLIIDNYPLNSITDLHGGKPWDQLLVKIGSTSYSLNNIENEIIRKRFTEPRIHFAVNCAAKSCPPLLNDAFYPSSLTNQLAARAKSFLANSNYNTISSSKLEVSKIFDWYGVDFGDVKNYIQKFTNEDLSNANLTFKEYDWALNKK